MADNISEVLAELKNALGPDATIVQGYDYVQLPAIVLSGSVEVIFFVHPFRMDDGEGSWAYVLYRQQCSLGMVNEKRHTKPVGTPMSTLQGVVDKARRHVADTGSPSLVTEAAQ